MLAGVPYGSDACWVPDGVPAIVLGPGNIAKAHAVDECVELDQVAQMRCHLSSAFATRLVG